MKPRRSSSSRARNSRGSRLTTQTTFSRLSVGLRENRPLFVKQVCNLVHPASKLSKQTRGNARALKKLDGVYRSLDLLETSPDKTASHTNESLQVAVELINRRGEGSDAMSKTIYETFSDESGSVSSAQLLKFFVEVQKMPPDDALPSTWNSENNVSTENLLRMLLEVPRFSAVDGSISHDMTKPLAHYWISSSHNTYLSGRQVGLKSASLGQYGKVLADGCRCIELDVHQGKKGFEVRHSLLTNALDLEKVLEVIKVYAFMTSEYPLILSVENHLSISATESMADLFRLKLAPLLLENPYGTNSERFSLCRPEDLRERILVKMRNARRIHAWFSVAPKSDWNKFNDDFKKRHKIISLSEKRARKLMSSGYEILRNQTVHKLVRVYPGNTRVNSSNYLPVDFWVAGCQMAALNLQTPGTGKLLHQALFQLNQKRGFYLKPEAIMTGEIPKHPVELLSIEVLSGHRFVVMPRGVKTDEPVQGFLKAAILGVDGDTRVVKHPISFPIAKDFPIEATVKFDLHVPEAAFLQIYIRSLTARIGTYTALVSSLRPGLRFLHMTDLLGQKTTPSSCLLVHIQRRPVHKTPCDHSPGDTTES